MGLRLSIIGLLLALSIVVISIASHKQMTLEDTFFLYQKTHMRIIEIDSQLRELKTHPDAGLQTSPLRQERVFICSKLYHAVSLYHLAPEKEKLDKFLPRKLDINFCLWRR
jgi:hypothetical protein